MKIKSTLANIIIDKKLDELLQNHKRLKLNRKLKKLFK
jgi:hypothetical protein